MTRHEVLHKLAHYASGVRIAERRIRHYANLYKKYPKGDRRHGRAGRKLRAWNKRLDWLIKQRHRLHRWLRLHPLTYPAGGWVRAGSPFRMERIDQGQDFEIPLGEYVRAPGSGEVVNHLSDGPFPNGFGSPYAIVRVDTGRFAVGDRLWYIGHANADVLPVGTRFKFGDKLARTDNSLEQGWGWVELGKATGGFPGPMGTGSEYHNLFRPLEKK